MIVTNQILTIQKKIVIMVHYKMTLMMYSHLRSQRTMIQIINLNQTNFQLIKIKKKMMVSQNNPPNKINLMKKQIMMLMIQTTKIMTHLLLKTIMPTVITKMLINQIQNLTIKYQMQFQTSIVKMLKITKNNMMLKKMIYQMEIVKVRKIILRNRHRIQMLTLNYLLNHNQLKKKSQLNHLKTT